MEDTEALERNNPAPSRPIQLKRILQTIPGVMDWYV